VNGVGWSQQACIRAVVLELHTELCRTCWRWTQCRLSTGGLLSPRPTGPPDNLSSEGRQWMICSSGMQN
jgi:hypothetical protein